MFQSLILPRDKKTYNITPIMTMRFIPLLILFFAVLFPTTLLAQTDSSESTGEQRTVFEIRNEGGNKYLKVLNELKALETDDPVQQSLKTAVIVPMASYLAPNDDYETMLSEQRYRFTADSLLTLATEYGHTGMNELMEALGREIQKKNLVMFSEHHFYPNHRRLIEKLLPLFKEAGYTYLALEALTEGQDSLLNKGNPPTIHSGFYTKDPRFANLIRTAQSLNFTFVGYENFDRNRDREEGQAANLVAATFEKDPDAKVLVLAGMAHIFEQPTSRGKKWLGAVLNEQYQLDPLTIDQNQLRYFEESVSDITIVKADVYNTSPLNSVDYQLINSLPLADGPSIYQFTNEYDERIQLSFYLRDEVDQEHTYDILIPVASKLIEPNETADIKLPESALELIIYDSSGSELERQMIHY